jgi:YcxB-like protein
MLTGVISASDYLDAQKLHRAKSVRWYYLASGCTIAVGVGLYFFSQRKLGFILVCAGIGGVIGELIMSTVYLPRKVRYLYRQQKEFAAPLTYTWNAEFLEAQGASGQWKRPWTNYAKYKENEKLFLLYHADNIFEMFPKSWFRDQTQVAEFRELASRAGRT